MMKDSLLFSVQVQHVMLILKKKNELTGATTLPKVLNYILLKLLTTAIS